MDFRPVELDPADALLRDEVRALFAEYLTDDVWRRVEESGSKFDEALYKAVGERGWILPERAPAEGGAGLTPFQCELLEYEFQRADAPLMPLSTTRLSLIGVEAFGDQELLAEVLPQVARGDVRICLGYTEPDVGSDVAAVKTRAVPTGTDWIVNGSKVFTTEGHNSQYAFLLARSDPDLPKHKGLTMFLVPLDLPGVEIGEIRTLGGERTSVIYFTDVCVSDRYRLGEVNGGWQVLLGPLNAEHGGGGAKDSRTILPLTKVGRWGLLTLHAALDAAVSWAMEPGPYGSRPIDDPALRSRLAHVAVHVEAAACVPDPFGRVFAACTCIEDCAELLNIVGPEAVEEGGIFEFAHRFAPGTSIYGGTVEIYKNIIAQHVLGLPRPLPAAR